MPLPPEGWPLISFEFCRTLWVSWEHGRGIIELWVGVLVTEDETYLDSRPVWLLKWGLLSEWVGRVS